MFKLFKSNPPTSEVIEQIHNEFDTAGEKLLKEALEIVRPNKFLLGKAEKLKMAGFKNSVEVKKAVEVKISADLASMVETYQRKYPNNKFITG